MKSSGQWQMVKLSCSSVYDPRENCRLWVSTGSSQCHDTHCAGESNKNTQNLSICYALYSIHCFSLSQRKISCTSVKMMK